MTLNELRRWLHTQSGLGDDDTRVVDAEGNDLHPTTGLLDGEHVMIRVAPSPPDPGPLRRRQGVDEGGLRRVNVLVLVDDHVAPGPAGPAAGARRRWPRARRRPPPSPAPPSDRPAGRSRAGSSSGPPPRRRSPPRHRPSRPGVGTTPRRRSARRRCAAGFRSRPRRTTSTSRPSGGMRWRSTGSPSFTTAERALRRSATSAASPRVAVELLADPAGDFRRSRRPSSSAIGESWTVRPSTSFSTRRASWWIVPTCRPGRRARVRCARRIEDRIAAAAAGDFEGGHPSWRRMPTVKVAVAMTVPTIPRTARVSRLASSVRTPAMSVDRRVSRFAISARTSARPARNWSDVTWLPCSRAVVDRLGDDLGLVAATRPERAKSGPAARSNRATSRQRRGDRHARRADHRKHIVPNSA